MTPPNLPTAMPFKVSGEVVFIQLDEHNNMDAFDVVAGVNDLNPNTPISEVAAIFKEYKEWKNEHETTA